MIFPSAAEWGSILPDFGGRADRSHPFARMRHTILAIAGFDPLHAARTRARGGNEQSRGRDETAQRRLHALFHAMVGQFLQGPVGAGAAGNPLPAGGARYPQGGDTYPGVSGQEPERARAAAGSRVRALSAGVQRDPLVHRRRHAARTGGPHRSRRGAAMDVLRAAFARAQSRAGPVLAHARQGRTRVAAAFARGLDGEGLSGALGDGEASGAAPLLRREPLHHRRHRALRLYARGARERLRPLDVSGDPRLAQARGAPAELLADGLESWHRSGGVEPLVPGAATRGPPGLNLGVIARLVRATQQPP